MARDTIGCCTACAGTGATYGGPCPDCYSTGCAHPEPLCVNDTLFDGYDPAQLIPTPHLADPTLSAGQRLTLRQKTDVERGVHPLTGEPAKPNLGTCGGCRFRNMHGGYPKCDRPAPPAVRRNLHSRSAATDVRAWWPACPKFEPKEKTP